MLECVLELTSCDSMTRGVPSEVGIGEGALGSSSEVVLLRGTVEVVPQLVQESREMSLATALNIEVDTARVDNVRNTIGELWAR